MAPISFVVIYPVEAISNSPANTATRAITPSKQDAAATKSATTKTSAFDFHSLSEQKHKIKEPELNPKQKFYKRLSRFLIMRLAKL